MDMPYLRIRPTSAATPAQPGDYPLDLAARHQGPTEAQVYGQRELKAVLAAETKHAATR